MKPSLLQRIDVEVAAGRAWRAKEIVRGHIAASWPEPAIIERYGQILARLGDHFEAGKFLFLSGARKAEYEDLVAMFLARYSRSRPEDLVAQFPKAFRRQEFAQLPPHVQTELESLGVREDAFGARKQPNRTAHSRWSGFVAMVAALAILASFIVGVGVGFRQIVLWLSALLE